MNFWSCTGRSGPRADQCKTSPCVESLHAALSVSSKLSGGSNYVQCGGSAAAMRSLLPFLRHRHSHGALRQQLFRLSPAATRLSSTDCWARARSSSLSVSTSGIGGSSSALEDQPKLRRIDSHAMRHVRNFRVEFPLRHSQQPRSALSLLWPSARLS